jgi:uncharacterized protein
MEYEVQSVSAFCLREWAADILDSEGMHLQKTTPHHKDKSTFSHSVAVAQMSLAIAQVLGIRVDERALVRGALLHDYYLYNCQEEKEAHPRHHFTHAAIAAENARRDFSLSDKEEDIIRKHMFPLNPALPKYRETAIVSIADKICAIREYLTPNPLPAHTSERGQA